MTLRALIFDFDGTILDTETHEYQAWQELYALHQAELPIALWARAVGTHGGFDPIGYLEERTGRAHDRVALTAAHRELVGARTAQLEPRPGIRALIANARRQGLALAVASSSNRPYIEDYLERLELASAFDAVCTASDVERVKPDPALFLLALTRLGVDPDEALVIEDSPNGVLAAQRAGIPCLVVPNEVTTSFVFPDYGCHRTSLAGIDVRYCAELLDCM
jgi:HAD superfamily hydrolase (TIGR01509 family)